MRYFWGPLALLPGAYAISNRHLRRDLQLQQPLMDSDSYQLQSDVAPSLLYPTYNISVPLDSFPQDPLYEPHSNESFPLRYWFDASHYEKGGPVILLLGGETDGRDRLPFLQKGLLQQLAQATNGIAVVLEHRYYGESYPTPDFSTENLRFLTTQQALADIAFFASNIRFPGLEKHDLTHKGAAYITYGGSYAGSMSAFMRVVYPDIIWGAISSSGVPQAIYDYWQYWTPVAKAGPIKCIDTQQTLVEIVDSILIDKKNATLTRQLKTAFGLGHLTHDDDFAGLIGAGIQSWQSRNWDPMVDSSAFFQYCDIITNASVVYSSTAHLRNEVASIVIASGVLRDYSVVSMLNLIGYLNTTVVSHCNMTQDVCFGNRDPTGHAKDDLTQTDRLWTYQYCTQWGYLASGSGTPTDQRPLISRLITPEYESIVCKESFNITTKPDLDSINQYGGYNISADRLALIDGEIDPWRPAGAHGFDQGAPRRQSTTNQPFILIKGAVHHWDENGLFDNQTTIALPPASIKAVQEEEIRFVKVWVKEWQESLLKHN